VAVIGGGPASLMAAEVLAAGGAAVTVYDRMPALARKLLLAGRGGLNLTHSEPFERFIARYGAAAPHLGAAIEAFPPAALRQWCEALGQPTFVGSSGRMFPTTMKASPLLRSWLRRLDAAGVAFRPRHHWIGWDASRRPVFTTPEGPVTVDAEATVLALGGASWPRLGSDGGWVGPLSAAGVAVTPLQPANCGFAVTWSDVFRDRFEGQPLKRIALSFMDRHIRGEAIITRDGLEGGAVYALSALLRDAITTTGAATLVVDLRPDVSRQALEQRLAGPRGKQSLSTFLRKVGGPSAVAAGLLRETALASARPLSELPPPALASLIKAVPVRLNGVAPLARAISTAGGVAFEAVDVNFMLRSQPGVFVAGEMLDWEAPTGGYLLQASFATGAAAARGALKWLARP
jgi:uncharacterized flavoprotein (TIGR03862 family)